jgi:hypothetical protein
MIFKLKDKKAARMTETFREIPSDLHVIISEMEVEVGRSRDFKS